MSFNFSSAPAPHSNQPSQEGPHTSTDHGRVPLNDISQLNHSSKKPYLCVSPGIWRPASQPANPTRNNTPGLLKNNRRCCLFNPVPIRLDRLPIHWGKVLTVPLSHSRAPTYSLADSSPHTLLPAHPPHSTHGQHTVNIRSTRRSTHGQHTVNTHPFEPHLAAKTDKN